VVFAAADAGDAGAVGDAGGPLLDHVALICADLDRTTAHYRSLGLRCTWSARGATEVDGVQEDPVEGADWLHLTGDEGYLSLAQAEDDRDARPVFDTDAGAVRFVHVGLAVPDIRSASVRVGRLGAASEFAPSSSIGERLYCNDPAGRRELGFNVELVEYRPGVARSGRVDQVSTASS
jgi:catechol 2,3-dioxygenase-like lactoylglutathione lyase family enzyme